MRSEPRPFITQCEFRADRGAHTAWPLPAGSSFLGLLLSTPGSLSLWSDTLNVGVVVLKQWFRLACALPLRLCVRLALCDLLFSAMLLLIPKASILFLFFFPQ